MKTILETTAGSLPRTRGKVRDVYDLGDRLVLVASDRISAFDWILPNGIPEKGKILTSLSLFWFRFLAENPPRVANHLISTDVDAMGPEFVAQRETFEDRSMLVRKLRMVPVECVVRGYLAGSGWKEYQTRGEIVGHRLPAGLVECERLPEPLFTPATKATSGHDENISFEAMVERVGRELSERLRDLSIAIYRSASDYAASRGLILADTKFEFGLDESGEIILGDEVLTPDSSRFWPASDYRPGGSQPSFDKQFVRDWLEQIGFDKQSPPPPLPDEVVDRTRAKYIEAFERLTGRPWGQTLPV